jgi:hypothetical protein
MNVSVFFKHCPPRLYYFLYLLKFRCPAANHNHEENHKATEIPKGFRLSANNRTVLSTMWHCHSQIPFLPASSVTEGKPRHTGISARFGI